MTFKDIIKRDVQQTFLNVDEFSEIHTVNGKPMAVQIDNNEQIEREKRYSQHMDGIYVKTGAHVCICGRLWTAPEAGNSRESGQEIIQSGRCDC